MYAIACIRPDITHAVCMVSRYMVKPGRRHQVAVTWILQYRRGMVDVRLIYGKGDTFLDVTGYSNSNYVGDLDGRKSLTSYIFTLAAFVISWNASLQSSIALSTMEAKYISLTEAAKEDNWLKELVNDVGLHQEKTVVF